MQWFFACNSFLDEVVVPVLNFVMVKLFAFARKGHILTISESSSRHGTGNSCRQEFDIM